MFAETKKAQTVDLLNAEFSQSAFAGMQSNEAMDTQTTQGRDLVSPFRKFSRRSFLRTVASLPTAAWFISNSSSARAEEGRTDIALPERNYEWKSLAIDVRVMIEDPKLNLKSLGDEPEKILMSSAEAKAKLLEREMRRAGTKLVFSHGPLKSQPGDPLGIRGILDVASLLPGIRAVAAVDPRRTDRQHLMEVEKQIEKDRNHLAALIGWSGYIHVGPDEPGYDPYYKLAAKYDLPVFLYTADVYSAKGRLKFAHPLLVDEAAVKHPDVRFIIVHFGCPWHMDAAEVIFKNDNVWTELSGLLPVDEKFEKLMDAGPLPDVVPWCAIADLKKVLTMMLFDKYNRVMFGSDWPWSSMAGYRRFIEQIIPKEHHHRVFRDNAEQLFLRNSK